MCPTMGDTACSVDGIEGWNEQTYTKCICLFMFSDVIIIETIPILSFIYLLPSYLFSAKPYQERSLLRVDTSVNVCRALSTHSKTEPGTLMDRPWRKSGGKSRKVTPITSELTCTKTCARKIVYPRTN